MLKRVAACLALGLGLLLGVAITYVPGAAASRNSSGTYSLPAGQPVVSGTTISSSTHNTFASDLATEITSSLDRSGRGAMLAPLQCTNGTNAAPSLTFASDPDTGFYRIGANNVGLALGGTKEVDFGADTTTFSNAVVTTASAANANGVTGTGNGTGNGVFGTGGATNAAGVYGVGTGTGAGVVGTGGTSGGGGSGGSFVGGGTNGAGVTSTGSGTGGGGIFGGGAGGGPGLVVTGTGTRGDIEISNGDPASTTGFSDSVTTMNISKAWVRVNHSTLTVRAGFNVASVTDNGVNNIDVNIANDFADTNYGCLATGDSAFVYKFTPTSAGVATISATDTAGGTVDLSDTGGDMTVLCFGAN